MSQSSQLHFNAMYKALHIVELIHYHPGWMRDCKNEPPERSQVHFHSKKLKIGSYAVFKMNL